jgi:hypothetical protein
MENVHFGSVTRIADLGPEVPAYAPVPRGRWSAGDYVLARVLSRAPGSEGFERADGREMKPMEGDLLVGAFARRFATLEAAGSFEAVGEDRRMHSLSEAGCFGKLTSRSSFSPRLMALEYQGHVLRRGEPLTMADCVPPAPSEPLDLPVILVIGTSMSAGKTFAARRVVRRLRALGRTVAAAKVTGAGRWHDVLTMGDAGAHHIFDFVDAGLPTTVCPESAFREAVGALLRRIGGTDADVLVMEAGASPLEPYNGGTAMEMVRHLVRFTILCASDPYAVVGIQKACPGPFDLVAGPAANTEAGIELVERLSGLEALDLMEPGADLLLGERLTAVLDG